MTAEQVIEQYNNLQTDRTPFDSLWQEIADYMLPNKADFSRLYGTGGQNRRQYIYDTTAEHSLNIFASSVMGFLANPASRWFTLETMDEEVNDDKEVMKWLDDAGQMVLNAFNEPSAKFYGTLYTTLLEIGAFGMGSMSVMPGQSSAVSFKNQPIKGLYILENNEGNIDTLYRCIKYKANQLLDKSEREDWNIPSKILKEVEKDPNKEYEVIHRIRPRNVKKDEFGVLSMDFESLYVLKNEKVVVHESGYEENPVPVARWSIAGDEQYGRGPGHVALADVKMINIMMRQAIMRAEKEMNPPTLLPEGYNHQIDHSPGAYIYYDPERGEPRPFNDRLDIGFSIEMMQSTQDAIRRSFYNDQLQLQGGPDMTATEVLQRQDEKARLLAPSIGMIQAELIGPVVQRTFSVMARKEMFPPAPEMLRDTDIKVVYVSPLSRAQRAGEAQNILSFMQNIVGLMQVDPSIRHKVNNSDMIDELAEITGVSPQILNSDKTYKELVAQDQQKQQTAETLQAADTAAGAAEKANKAGLI